jgi:hypothetical protein
MGTICCFLHDNVILVYIGDVGVIVGDLETLIVVFDGNSP